ncbi:DNA mismatch repair protein MutL [Eubacterium uniforme]|uniref:DNA mismatch repair protein MutL n=1 Tax=Eubacterium uniforme TaxID=39495 RepID=A0A1T4V626_9FIRM|nr:DNA mismatch repair endonuclease MutL [Eubacterium uniforme]SKA60302.1 DNA mismatch repair protein MutL [Eubacterium uniforme]
MGKINVLDQNTINRIAAGEVIDRPSSIVKELLENAIDAKATNISVEIKNGGLDMIRISDNGIGFDKDDIKVAFLRHTTSKIKTAEDLVSVGSLGFRGEALSSIAAVCQVELLTKQADEIYGYRYAIEGGEEKKFEEVGLPDGTTFVVRNIFFNTPARRKFLKSGSTEGGYITDIVQKIALSNPDISFVLKVNGNTKIHTPGNGNLRDVIYSIYGRDITKNLVEIDESNDFLKIHGFIGKPVVTRGNRGYENYYINKRYIKSSIISKAIEEGYKTFIMQHMYPFTNLFIEIDSNLIDVNVHPSKMELRFKRGNEIFDFIVDIVRKALRQNDLIRDGELLTEAEKKEAIRKESQIAAREEDKVAPKADGLSESAGTVKSVDSIKSENPNVLRNDIIKPQSVNNVAEDKTEYKSKVNDFGVSNKSNVTDTNIANNIDNTKLDNNSKIENNKTISLDNVVNSPSPKKDEEVTKYQNETKSDYGIKKSSSYDELFNKASEPFEANRKKEDEDLSNKLREEFKENVIKDAVQESLISPNVRADDKPDFRIVGQVFDTYWIIEYKNSMYIIDQHAAHEKVNYEKYLKQFKENGVDKQYLNPPVVISLNGQAEAVVNEYKDNLDKFGYEIENFGDKEYIIRSVPYNLLNLDYADVLQEFIGKLDSNMGSLTNDTINDRIATMSCKAAIKGNMAISEREANELVSTLLTLDDPFNCPHGRPTMIEISKKDMERKFKRIV